MRLKIGRVHFLQLQKNIDALELQAKSLEQGEKNKRERLDYIKNQQEYKAIEHEMEHVRKERLNLENLITELWYQLEIAKNDYEKDKNQIAQKESQLVVDIQTKEALIKNAMQKLDELQIQRPLVSGKIPEEWLLKYERMKHSVADPIVSVINGNCSACYYSVLYQDLLRLKKSGYSHAEIAIDSCIAMREKMETQTSIFNFACKDDKSNGACEKKHNVTSAQIIQVFIDGAARGNPGPAGAGVYIKTNLKEIKEAFFLGKKTNNQAEYLALMLAVFLIKTELKQQDKKNIFFKFHSDSELLVRQFNGVYKIKNSTLLSIKLLVNECLDGFQYKFFHVYREKNKIADKLANDGIDKKKKIPTDFFDFLANLDGADDINKLVKT